MLTKQQLAHFETFGFIIMRHAFTAKELAIIDDEYERGLTSAYAHAPFDGTVRHWTNMLGSDTPFFATLLEDARFYEVAEQLYGEDVLAESSSANRYIGNTLWHPDHQIDANEDSFGIKLAFYLDPVDGQSGALRVIPGSHRNPLHDGVRAGLERLGKEISEIPGHVCESKPGDVVAFGSGCSSSCEQCGQSAGQIQPATGRILPSELGCQFQWQCPPSSLDTATH